MVDSTWPMWIPLLHPAVSRAGAGSTSWWSLHSRACPCSLLQQAPHNCLFKCLLWLTPYRHVVAMCLLLQGRKRGRASRGSDAAGGNGRRSK